MDDTLFLRAAQHIQTHPFNFYGFHINWYGSPEPMWQVFENPPLTSYYIALVSSLFGWSEIILHLALLVIALLATWGIYSLARHHCDRPFLAAVIAVLTPVFVVSATNVMCDVALLALWVWSLSIFEAGLKRPTWTIFIFAGLLAGSAILTKLIGLALIPLLFAYGFVRQRHTGRWLISILIPILVAAAYQCITYRLYGRGLLIGAAHYASGFRQLAGTGLLSNCLVALIFTGGCFIPVFFYSFILWKRRAWLIGFGILLVSAIAVFLLSGASVPLALNPGTPHPPILVQTAVFTAAGASLFLFLVAECRQRRDPTSLLLVLWIAGIFAFAAFVNWTVSARSLLPMAPAVGILVARRASALLKDQSTSSWWLAWPLFPTAAIAIALAAADYSLAGATRTAASQITQRYSTSHSLFFEGHWGFQFYMENRGAKPLDLSYHKLAPGELVVLPSPSSNVPGLPTNLVHQLQEMDRPSVIPFATLATSASAGFYSSLFGSLPYSMVSGEPARFRIFEVIKPDEQGELQVLAQGRTGADRLVQLQAAVARNPENAVLQFSLANALMSASKPSDAIAHYQEGLRLMPDSIEGLNNLAWILATDPDPRLRNGPEAVKLAGRACELDGNKTPVYLGTLAAAYAEAGQFDAAIATANEAITKARSAGLTEIAAANEKLLQLYGAGQPFHRQR